MMNCPVCNAECEPEDQFCSNCGTAVDFAHTSEVPLSAAAEPSFVDLAMDRPHDTFAPTETETPADPDAGQSNSQFMPIADFEDIDTTTPDEAANNGKNLWLIGAAIATILLIGMLYYWLFISDDIAPPPPAVTPVAAKAIEPTIAAVAMFAVTQADIRYRASTKDSQVTGKLTRGEAAKGRLALGEDGTSNWLELSDGRGFVSAVNLSDTAPPRLAKTFSTLIWTAKDAVNILAQPESNGTFLLRVSAGTKLTFAGITANDFAEVKMKQGGVGYIADAAALLAEPDVIAPVIAIKFNAADCGYGSELDGQFKRLFAKAQSDARTIEDADYPDAEARNRALATISGKSHYQRLERSFSGLTVTGIGQHYESTSIYFAEPSGKVTAIFRSLGYKVGANGMFPEQESVGAGIGATSGETSVYGKSDLTCGA